ncbi:sodium:proton antiporter, partial [Devosia sp.]|uniref:cation:proton antiporter n=1 Tax=Devosia sp. TaxID=1871048 RepID=UPI002AFE4EFD
MFAHILLIMIVAIAISGLAERRNAQPALVVATLGLVASFIPGVPSLELEPDIILGIVLPPMLFSAASDFSFGSFIKRLGSIINLGVLMVFATAIAVAAVAGFSVAGLTPMAALVLGAVLAPPDAVTAITIGRKAGLPSGLMTVLKGESLINDAAALTLFAVAVAATTGTHAFIDNLALYFLYTATVGVLAGLVMGQVAAYARRKLGNPSLATAVSVILPFAAYLVAEELHASGVLAVVAAGFAIGHSSAESGYAERIQERQFWRTVDTLLETFVFAYIGLQLRFIITDAQDAGYDLVRLVLTAGAIFLSTVAIRFAWVFCTALIARWRTRALLKRFEHHPPPPGRRRLGQGVMPLTWKENTVLAWTGMRGVVTLAAAAGVPTTVASGADFPGREAILTIAFLVTIATLLIQGSTLPWMIGALDLSGEEDKSHAQEQHRLARSLAQQAMLEALEAYRRENPSPAAQRMA